MGSPRERGSEAGREGGLWTYELPTRGTPDYLLMEPQGDPSTGAAESNKKGLPRLDKQGGLG